MALIYPAGLTASDFSTGATNAAWQTSAFCYGSPITIPSAGTVTQMGVYTYDNGGGQTFKIALYDSSGNLVGSSTGTGVGVTPAWANSGTVSLAVTAGTYYVMVSGSDNNIQWQYDGTADGYYGNTAFASFPADPETITQDTGSNDLFGVRVDFTAGGGALALTDWDTDNEVYPGQTANANGSNMSSVATATLADRDSLGISVSQTVGTPGASAVPLTCVQGNLPYNRVHNKSLVLGDSVSYQTFRLTVSE